MAETERESRRLGSTPAPIIRFVLVGAINTGFGYGIYCFFLYLGAPYPMASFFALAAGVIWSFVTSGRFVFRSRLRGRFPKYVLVWGGLYFVNIFVIGLIMQFGFDAYIAGFLALAPMVAMAYILQKRYVFAD